MLVVRPRLGAPRPRLPHMQRRLPPQPLAVYLQLAGDRDTAIYRAYRSGGYRLKGIGDHFGFHYSRVSRIVKKIKGAKDKTGKRQDLTPV
ncbi:hypothetical protein [Motiliproteus sp. SC1-56]|uniref:hypothetical protein n=1 Tax=Motiliproteus sp. SC1-56 TaxID=2799565 RepID=UPI001A8D10C7|nr:hypothetical protein [Motiliproteus sp. SC1-56]